jgi:hypothetical protein
MGARYFPPFGRHSASPCLFLANLCEFTIELKSEGGQGKGILPTPSFLYGFAKARKPGRFAWHHEAVISPKIRREETPRPLRRMKKAFPFSSHIPTDAAGANRPGFRAQTKVRVKCQEGGRTFPHTESGGYGLVQEGGHRFRDGMAGSWG